MSRHLVVFTGSNDGSHQIVSKAIDDLIEFDNKVILNGLTEVNLKHVYEYPLDKPTVFMFVLPQHSAVDDEINLAIAALLSSEVEFMFSICFAQSINTLPVSDLFDRYKELSVNTFFTSEDTPIDTIKEVLKGTYKPEKVTDTLYIVGVHDSALEGHSYMLTDSDKLVTLYVAYYRALGTTYVPVILRYMVGNDFSMIYKGTNALTVRNPRILKAENSQLLNEALADLTKTILSNETK